MKRVLALMLLFFVTSYGANAPILKRNKAWNEITVIFAQDSERFKNVQKFLLEHENDEGLVSIDYGVFMDIEALKKDHERIIHRLNAIEKEIKWGIPKINSLHD